MKKLFFTIVIIFTLFATSESKEIVDLLGRKVKVTDNVERLVAIGPGALRLVIYLSGLEKVVGVERVEKGGFVPYGRPYTLAIREKVKHLPLIGEGGPGKLPDFEAIISVRPDVIFAIGFEGHILDMIQEKTRIPVVGLHYGALGELKESKFYDSLKLVASLLKKENRLKEIEEFLKRTEAYFFQRTKSQKERPRAYAGGIGFRGQHGITSTEAGFLPFKLANVKNVADEVAKDGHLFIEKERLLVWNPDYIFVDVNGLSIFEKEFLETPTLFMNLKAFKEGRVYTILPYNYYNTNVELAISDAYFVAKVVYPDQFKDVNIDEESARVIRFFVGESVYPEIKKNFGRYGRLVVEKGKINIVE
ncbi:MAG: iron ABC transporter substrate-binding protein [Desulfobacterota bacterium]|nr:iron ABC transporter substrate-binding protein [Thermodesulfobacteriota bacterium]MDW8001455.1 iron ABC transporter substrate-binding protein [Deltaproteobacteria bacterium]